MARSLALLFSAWILSPAQGDPVLSADMSGVASPDAAAHERAAGEAVDDSSPDELLLDEAQASRLKEIPNLKAEFDARGVPTVLEGALGYYRGEAPDAELLRLLQELGPAYRAKGTERLRQANARVNAANIGVYRTGQYIGEIPVHGAGLIIITDSITGQITRIKGDFLPDRNLPKEAKVPAASAMDLAAEAIAFAENAELQDIHANEKPELVYHIGGHLCWRFILEFRINDEFDKEMIVVDAVNGSLIERDDVRIE